MVTWPTRSTLTPSEVRGFPYPDFVATINQTNVPPGAYATLSRLRLWSGLNAQSRLLEVACTTGFTSRTLAEQSGCSAVGFDSSALAIQMARLNAAPLVDCDIRYDHADGRSVDYGREFTHVAIGAALGFFPNPTEMAMRLTSWVTDGGFILASPVWAPGPLSSAAQHIRTTTFGINSPMESRRDVLAQFRGLRLYYCEDFEYYDEHDTEIRHYCDSTIDRYVGSAGIEDDGVIEACWSRLYEICMSAKLLHREQRYSVMVLQYVEGEYPRRFVEHF